jgi:predicted membrane protein
MQGVFSTVVVGLLLILFGILFLLDQSGTIDFDFWDFLGDIWPVALIILGIWIIYNQARGAKSDSRHASIISGRKVFGNIDATPDSTDSEGLDYDVTFGDIHILLTKTEFMPGENKIRVSVGFGEINIVLPDDIPCKIYSSCGIGDIRLFGESTSGLPAKREYVDDTYESSEKKINIRAKCGLGDVRIKRA